MGIYPYRSNLFRVLVRLPIVTDTEYIHFIGPDIMTPKVHCKLLVKIIIICGYKFPLYTLT